MKSNKNMVLGRGLSALIPTTPKSEAVRPEESIKEVSREYFRCPIESIRPTQDQPRRQIDQKKLEELAESIRAQGMIQPLVVRKEGEMYHLIAGERRWRAAQLAGLREVPVVVKETSLREAFEMALVENLQREDLNPIEEAEGYQRLQDEYQYTQEVLALRVGKERATITNSLRLLSLPEGIRRMLARGELSAGHGRALLGIRSIERMLDASKEVLDRGMSVRQTEALVRRLKDEAEDAPPVEPVRQSSEIRSLSDELMRLWGARVQIKDKGAEKGGTIQISYNSYSELERLLDMFRGS